jgi:hypothetical protein
MKGQRRYALLGFLAWKLMKRSAKQRARHAVGKGGSGRGRAVVMTLVGVAAAVGALFWWRSRESGDVLTTS